MRRGKYAAPRVPWRDRSKKTLAMLLSLVLVIGCAVGGTLAWLTATSGEVKNQFSTSDIGVTLEESENLDLKMIPGWSIKKDPKAAVTADSEDCYLFVKVDKSANFDQFMTYAIADGWTQLNDDGVYYRIFDSRDSGNTNVKGTAYSVLRDDQVQVLGTVTKEALTALTDMPTLTFQAYAVQLYKDNGTQFTAAEAWALLGVN